jgi:hypothetical protein
MVLVTGLSGTFLYDAADPIHPRAVCRIDNTSVHILTGTSLEYLKPQPNGTTDVVLHSLGSNNESVVTTFHTDMAGSNLGSPFASISWPATASVLGYSAPGGLDANGSGITAVWAANTTSTAEIYAYSVPGRDTFGRPGFPPPVLAISADNAYMAAGWTIAGPLHVFRLSDRADVSPSMPSDTRFAFWSRAGHTLYIVSNSGVQVWAPESGSTAVPATLPWTLGPNFSPDGTQVAFTALPTRGVIRVYVYDFKAKSSRLLIDQPRSGAMFVKSGWVWYLEEMPCVQSGNNQCFDPTEPDGNVLAMNLATGQETPVTFAAGESPVSTNMTFMSLGDIWPLG